MYKSGTIIPNEKESEGIITYSEDRIMDPD